jgi:long-chain fatty acid transport protein
MKRFLKNILVFGTIIALSSPLFSNGINLNGIGTKAVSMGGAFIGLADDFSAVFWNPAGLTQMKSSNLSLSGAAIFPTGTYQTDVFNAYGLPSIDAQTESKVFPNPSLGYFKVLSEKLVVGFALYAPSGIGATWNGDDLTNFSPDFATSYNWESMMGAFVASPVIAYKVSDSFSIGATINLIYGMLNMDRATPMGQYTEKIDGFSFGATFGAMIKPADWISIGLTVRTPSKLNFKGDAEMPGAALIGAPTTTEAEREMDWPLWGGIGIALKPTDKLTITADAQYTNWEKMGEIEIIYSDPTWQAVLANGSKMVLNWEDKVQIRFGLEYMVSETLALRAGYYTDPAPAPNTTLNILMPSISSNWICAGIGYYTDSFNLDLGFEYNLGGTDRDSDPLSIDAMPGTHGLSIFVPMVAVSFKF